MTRIGLVTNVNEKCGVAEYAHNLMEYAKGVEFKVVDRPFTVDAICQRLQDVNIAHFNFSGAIFTEFKNWYVFQEVKHRLPGKKLVLTLQDSFDELVQVLPQLNVFDKIVVHDTEVKSAKVCVIPHGIRATDVSGIKPELKIGTAGFPFPWKCFEAIAYVAGRIGIGFYAVVPDSDKVQGLEEMYRICKDACPTAEFEQGWFTQDEVIRKLATCSLTAFPYGPISLDDKRFLGVSGAARFGVAAQRPVIVSQCSMFRDLKPYQDEVYFVPPPDDDQQKLSNALAFMEAAVRQVFRDEMNGGSRRPKKILEDMNWNRCAEMYVKVYQEVMNGQI